MSIYIKLFEVLFPVFFVVGIGYYLGKKNPKIDTTFITNFAANVGTPAMIIYALNPVNISFNIFINYFWYYLIAIGGFMISWNNNFVFTENKRHYKRITTSSNAKYWKYGIANMFICLWSFWIRCFCCYICFNYFVSFYSRSIFSR